MHKIIERGRQWKDGGDQKETIDGEPVRVTKLEVDDVTTYLDKDGSDNLTFTDAVTGTRTLADFVQAGILFVIDGGGSVITTGIKGDIEVPFACTIERCTMMADQSGSIVVDIWKDTYANFPPEDADSITASAVPTITTATKSQDSTLTGWTTSITAGDVLRFNVDSVTTVERVSIVLSIKKD